MTRRIVALVGVAIVLAFASSAVRRTRLEVQEWDCPPAPASCARPVLVLGFPVSYISDHHGISVVGDASLFGALLGEDRFHWRAFVADVAVYLVIAAAAATATRAVQRRSAQGT